MCFYHEYRFHCVLSYQNRMLCLMLPPPSLLMLMYSREGINCCPFVKEREKEYYEKGEETQLQL